MKRVFIYLILSLTLIGNAVSQNLVKKDGKYVDETNTLYTGIYKEYFENGNIKVEMNIEDGVQDGYTNIYFNSGIQNEQRSYKEGKMHGTWITWNEMEVKLAEANYNFGEKHGKWFIWD